MVDRLPPHDIEAEEAVIGSLLIGGEIKNSNGIKGTDFYSERNRWVFEACQRLTDRGISLNQITIGSELGEKLPDVGGAAYLSYLISICPTFLDLPYYADIVERLSFYRRLIAVADQVAGVGYQADHDVSQSMKKCDDLILDLRKQVSPLEIITPEARFKMLSDRYEKLNQYFGGVALQTGLADLDHRLGGGFHNGELVVIGARTGVGKTTALQTIANNVGQKENVLYFTCEMSTESMSDRDVAGYTQKSVSIIRNGDYEQSHRGLYPLILEAVEYVRSLNVYYVQGSINTEKVREVGFNMQTRYGLRAVMVDYLSLLKDRYGDNEEQRIGYISRSLKQIAMELNVPVITAHQLNRGLENREDKRPQLYDLRGSGSIENDADVVILLFRQNYYNKSQDPTTEFIIAKQRQGQANKIVKVFYDNKGQRYCNLSEDKEDGKQNGLL